MDSDSDNETFTPPNIVEAATAIKENLLPACSKRKYMQIYNHFNEWKKIQNSTSYSENVLLAYFSEISENCSASTLWTKYSMLKSTLITMNDINIGKFAQLKTFIKRQSEGYIPKKSKILSACDINKFINNAPDSQFLGTKIALIFGVMGACRKQELYNLKFEDIKLLENTLLVTLKKTKNKTDRIFTVTGKYYELCIKYINLRPPQCKNTSFFLNYNNGKTTMQRMGIHKIGFLAKTIAEYLSLPNPELYTGHCLRRTSATLLVDAGGDITSLKRHRGWKSTTVAEGYIDHSVNNKIQMSVSETGKSQPVAGSSRDTGSRSYFSSSTEDSDDDEDSSSRRSSTVLQIGGANDGSRLDDQSMYSSEVKIDFAASDGDSNENFVCNQCHGLIVRFRYVCVECADYDLCGACESHAHHAAHYMLRVPSNKDLDEVMRTLSEVRAAVRLATAAAPATHAQPPSPVDDDHHMSETTEIKTEIKEEIDIEEFDPLSAAGLSHPDQACEVWTHKSGPVDSSQLLLVPQDYEGLPTVQTDCKQKISHTDVMTDMLQSAGENSSMLPAPTKTLMPEDRDSYKLETSGKQLEDTLVKRSFEPDLSKLSSAIPQKKIKIMPVKKSNLGGNLMKSSSTSDVSKTVQSVSLSDAAGKLTMTKVELSEGKSAELGKVLKLSDSGVHQVKGKSAELVKVVDDSEKAVTVHSDSDNECINL